MPDRTAPQPRHCANIRRVIDLHTHVLPGLDDGPSTLDGSLAVAEVAARAGTRTLVATPHLRADHPAVRPAELATRAGELTEQLRERGLPVEVLPGAEVDLVAAAGLARDELALATLGGNGSDLLVETPYGPLPIDFPDHLLALAGRGFRLTLAHPERSRTIQARPELVGTLVERGILVQLTASSLSGRGGSAGAARTLLERGWAHVLASDAHALDRRPPDLGAQLREAIAALPQAADELEWMVTVAPRAILDGRPLGERPARRARRRRLRLRLR
jgi:protein-tyrosine phosphatase